MKHPVATGPLGAPRFGLYIHWPFCVSKCPYCDFNSHVSAQIELPRWRDAYAREIARAAHDTGPRVLETIFFGGGTPSLMPPDLVAGIIDAARAAWPVANTIEITMEANPGSVDAARFRGYRDAGVSRISIGLQAIDDGALRRLGRMHSAAEGLRAVEIAQVTFPRVNLDLIYARQDQTVRQWEDELDTALRLGTEHLSLYQLTVEPDTVFAARAAAGQLRGLPDEDRAVSLFEVTQARCEAAGLPAYEISNHARPGAECRHNLIYWTGGDYVGIGPGAHGRVTRDGQRVATEAHRAPADWLHAVETGGSGNLPDTPLDAAARVTETLLMGLRLRGGVAWVAIPELFRPDPAVMGHLLDAGLLHLDDTRLQITERGRLLTDGIIAELASHLP
ncbi:MAG: radical SAM family heme chaperone HemW [Gemmobacter sp.]